MGSGPVQPGKETWVHSQVILPPTGGFIEVQCCLDQVGVKGRGLQQSLKLAIGTVVSLSMLLIVNQSLQLSVPANIQMLL